MSELQQQIGRLSAEKRAQLEQLLLQRRASARPGIRRRLPDDPNPPSFAQQRLWFLDQWDPGAPTYNAALAVRMRGELDREALQRALDTIVVRHEVLRTTLRAENGQPVPVLLPPAPVELSIADLRELPLEQQEGEIQRRLLAETRRSFDLSRDLMLRVGLLRVGEQEHLLLLVAHHIACDGWSRSIFFHELTELYGAYVRGLPSPLPELPIQYSDFALWQQEWLRGERLQREVDYWAEQLAGAPPSLDLTTDRPRPRVQSFLGRFHWLTVPADTVAAAKALSRAESATLFMTLLAAFNVFLWRYSGQEDILVGTPIAGRSQVETEPLIGFFVNTLVIRTMLAGAPSFRELLHRVRAAAVAAYAHQELPFEKIVDALQPPRDAGRNPLFQVNFRVQTAPSPPMRLPGLTLEMLESDTGTSRFDLALELRVQADDSIRGYIEYNTALFEPPSIVRMEHDLRRVLTAVLEAPDTPLSQVGDLTAVGRRSPDAGGVPVRHPAARPPGRISRPPGRRRG